MIIPHAKPGTSISNKTGEWKAFRPIIDESKCIKCGICQRMCPEGIMGKKGEVPKIDYNYCKGCSICVNVCPVKAITMERVEKE